MPLIGNHRILSILLNTARKWEPGWSLAAFAHVSGSPRLLLYNQATGQLQSRATRRWGVHGLNAGDEVNVGADWSTMTTHQLAPDAVSVVLTNHRTGDLVALEIDSGGTVGGKIVDVRWTRDLNRASGFELGGTSNLLRLNTGLGNYEVRRVAGDGSIGPAFDGGNWGSGLTILLTYGIDSARFVLACTTDQVRIRRIDPDGAIGPVSDSRRLSAGIDTACVYEFGSSTFVMLNRSATGSVEILELNRNGTIGGPVSGQNLGPGWTTTTSYALGSMPVLFLLNADTGAGDLRGIRPDGSVGDSIIQAEPHPKERYQRLMTEAGRSQELLFDYIHDQSEGHLSIAGSEVAGWLTYSGSWEELKYRGRGGQIQAGIDTARAAGVDVDRFDGYVVFVNEPPNSGAGGSRTGVLVHPRRETLEFISHEVLHTFDLDHSFSADENAPKVAAWEKDGAYDDPYDIMSAERSWGYGGVEFAQRGPNLNAFGRSVLGWLAERSVIDRTTSELTPGGTLSVRIAALASLQPAPRVVRLRGPHDDYLSIEYRYDASWDRGFTAGLPLIHHVRPAKYFGYQLDRRKWSPGWTSAVTYRPSSTTYLLMLKEATGDVYVGELDEDGRLGGEVERHQWQPGWTTVETFQTSAGHYLFLGKVATGEVHIHPLLPDGRVGSAIARYSWSVGWTTAECFTDEPDTYLILLKEGDGSLHMHRMFADGKVGPLLLDTTIESGWTNLRVANVGAKRFAVLSNANDGQLSVRSITDDQALGHEVWTGRFGVSADHLEVLGTDPTRLLLGTSAEIVPEGTRRFFVARLHEDGSISQDGSQGNWTAGWTAVIPYTNGVGRHLFGIKEGDGTVFTMRMCASFLLRDTTKPNRPPTTSTTIADVDVVVTRDNNGAVVTMERAKE